uniref:Uncharacterized protein n=2 Tax=Caenorhabditis japonica TaxID=281687 RepID=A0A8R1EQB5_CAEJA
MSLSVILFAVLIGQAFLGSPTRYDFDTVELTQSEIYNTLTGFTNAGKVYCEALAFGSPTTTPYKPLFEQKYLARVEYKETWCPPPKNKKKL